MISVYLKCFFFFWKWSFPQRCSTLNNVVKLDAEKDNFVSTLSIVVYINFEIRNVDSTFFDVVNSNVEIHNVVSALVWRCPTSRRHISQKTKLKQRWNVCWVKCEFQHFLFHAQIILRSTWFFLDIYYNLKAKRL